VLHEVMMTPGADVAQNADAISAYLANERVNVLGSEQLLDEGATIAEHGDAPAVVAAHPSRRSACGASDDRSSPPGVV